MNKKEFGILVTALGVAVMTLDSCGTYEDGPSISLRTKDGRLTGEWLLVEADGLTSNLELIFEFQKDGDFKQKITYEYSYYGQSYTETYIYKGDWEWNSGKESIEITIDNDVMDMDILKLTNDELVLEYDNNDEWVFEKQ